MSTLLSPDWIERVDEDWYVLLVRVGDSRHRQEDVTSFGQD
jgi:hypothetical protein